MNRVEILDLLTEIKRNYPSFDVSDESIERHSKYLRDFPFDAAMQNVEDHIRTDRFPPTIADIRGRLGDQMESQKSKEQTASYFAQVELWKHNAAPPPDGMRERIYAMTQEDAE